MEAAVINSNPQPVLLQLFDRKFVAHACQMPNAMHFYNNSGECVFCGDKKIR